MSRSIIKTAGAIGLFTGLIALVGFLLLGLSHEVLTHQKALSLMDVSSHREGLMYWRYAFYITILLCWSSGIRYLGKRKNWSQESIDYLAKRQLLVVLFFSIIELFFVYNLLGHVFSIL